MRRLSLLTLLALGCAAGDPVFDGSSQPIVDGELESGYPEVVFLYNISGAACTATIISPRVVLTAKHCVQDGRNSRAAPASNFRVFGSRATTAPQEIAHTRTFHEGKHPHQAMCYIVCCMTKSIHASKH